LRQRSERGSYDRALVDAVLDEALVCHVAFADAGGQPFAIPTNYARLGDRLLIHGAPGSRLLRALAAGAPACVTVTLLDGLVLARSAFHHSMNYRSVVILGRFEVVGDREAKRAALTAVVEHVLRGRAADARPPTDAELDGTLVVALRIEEASAKVRAGPPADDREDMAVACWAGVVPLQLVAGAPVPDPALAPDTPLPDGIARYRRSR
jgi:nitroimidazol reductase NimA-like FMN-containing flavoprotein (pyridoxamine 5'-phosphate oxidase superfamily)